VLAALEVDGKPLADDALLAWLEGGAALTPALPVAGRLLPLQRLSSEKVPARFGFVRTPSASSAT
jgi:hypothetical protein